MKAGLVLAALAAVLSLCGPARAKDTFKAELTMAPPAAAAAAAPADAADPGF
jgi:hypothetical protein